MAKKVTTLLTIVLLFTALLPLQSTQAQDATSIPASELDASVLIKWMDLLYDRIEAEGLSAPAASRLYAYAGITAYQAVLPGVPEGIPMTGQLTGLGDFPAPIEGQVYDWASSANAALSTVIAGLFPENAADTQKAIKVLRDSQSKALAKNVSAQVIKDSMDFGDSVGQTVLDWMVLDNYVETRDLSFDLPTGDPALWVPPPADQVPVEPYWGQIRPFALYYADQCNFRHNMPFSDHPQSTFYAQAQEVKLMGDNLTNEQKDMVRFWNDAPGESGTTAGHWVLIENQMIDLLGLKLDRSAMMYALVGTAMGDASISAASLQYQVNLLSPISYINEYLDPDWKPFLTPPNSPAYPSDAAVVSSAASEVLTGMFGMVAFADHSVEKHGMEARSFTSLHAAASESALSSVYGGVSYREAIENGQRQGECVGQQILNYVLLRSIPQGE